jgi:hypothetical protein
MFKRKAAAALTVCLLAAFSLGFLVAWAAVGDIVFDDTSVFGGDLNVEGTLTASNLKVGKVANCVNGTWIAHNLPGDPGTAGSLTLSLRGPSAFNATFIYKQPTILSSNSTHFQIEFLAWYTGDWSQVPVTAVEATTVWWIAAYYPT